MATEKILTPPDASATGTKWVPDRRSGKGFVVDYLLYSGDRLPEALNVFGPKIEKLHRNLFQLEKGEPLDIRFSYNLHRVHAVGVVLHEGLLKAYITADLITFPNDLRGVNGFFSRALGRSRDQTAIHIRRGVDERFQGAGLGKFMPETLAEFFSGLASKIDGETQIPPAAKAIRSALGGFFGGYLYPFDEPYGERDLSFLRGMRNFLGFHPQTPEAIRDADQGVLRDLYPRRLESWEPDEAKMDEDIKSIVKVFEKYKMGDKDAFQWSVDLNPTAPASHRRLTILDERTKEPVKAELDKPLVVA